jgi:FkbM family methyltransferase
VTTLLATTPSGQRVSYVVRDDTNDGALVTGILMTDEYRLASLPPLEGWAIDVGAHVGTVSLALAAEHPGLRVLAVEALPENCEVLLEAVRANGWTSRIVVVEAAATGDDVVSVDIPYGWSWSANQPDHYMAASRFIGGMVPANESSTTISCPGISLAELMGRYGIERVALLKIDCEGCEWAFLASPAISRVERIIGEYHDRGFASLEALLSATHDVTHLSGESVGTFEAVLR